MERFIYYASLYTYRKKRAQMAKQKISRTRTITLSESGGTFSFIFHRFRGEKKKFDYADVTALRQLLSNEKSRLLHTIKTKQPNSIYELAKLLARDFKAVRHDIRLLEKFGFIELITVRKDNREKLKPVLAIDELIIKINI